VTGTQSPDGLLSIEGHGIYHVGSDGIYLYNASGDQKVTQAALEPIFRGEDTNGVLGISNLSTCWLGLYKNQIYFGYQDDSDSYCANVFVFNLENKRGTYYHFGSTEIRCVAIDQTNNYLLAGDNAGFVWRLEDPNVTTDDGTVIAYECQSKDFTLQTRAHFPRWIKYDVDASSATTANGRVILDGTTLQSHTLSGNRDTTKRLITTGNGERCSMRIDGTGPVSIYASEME
jgi:hypothetical protein